MSSSTGQTSRLAEIDERLEQVRADLVAFADQGDLDEEQAERFDALEAELVALEEEREPLARRAATLDRVRAAIQGGPRAVEADRGPDLISQRRDPFADLAQVRTGMVPVSDLRARALTAIEQAPDYVPDDQREQATRLVERGDRHGRIARHMLLTGSPAYERAFEAVLTGEEVWALAPEEQDALRQAREHHRSVNIGTDAQGGYLVPFYVDPTIIVLGDGVVNPLRQISRVVSITTNTWHGITRTGIEVEWLAEAEEATGTQPTYGRPEIPTHKAGAWITATFEAAQDTTITSQIGGLLAEAKAEEEAEVFTIGTGTGQPTGVVTAVAAVASSVVDTAGAGTYEVGDVYALRGALPPRYRSNSVWLGNDQILLATRQFAGGAGPSHAFWADLGVATPSQLLGRPVYESSVMADEVTAGANILMLGDFSRYVIVDRIGMTVQHEPLVKGTNQRPTGEMGWFAHWRVGADVVDANAFRLLQVAA